MFVDGVYKDANGLKKKKNLPDDLLWGTRPNSGVGLHTKKGRKKNHSALSGAGEKLGLKKRRRRFGGGKGRRKHFVSTESDG